MSDTDTDSTTSPNTLPATVAGPPSNAAVQQNEQGKANSLLNKIADKLDRLSTLTVVTVVSDVETFQDDPDRPTFLFRPKGGASIDAFQTQVNLVTGDIENLISRDFATNPAYKDLSDFHLAQVTKSNEIVSTNLKAVRDLAVQLSGRSE